MSDSSAFGFGKFIPGFDFLQNLGKAGQGTGGMPPFAHWVAPTVSVEEIEKRIEELKAVQFWLEQNSRALAATVQALEVQRMTLSTLKGMNVNLSDLGKAFPFAAATAASAATTANKAGSPLSDWPMSTSAPTVDTSAQSATAGAQPHPAVNEKAEEPAKAKDGEGSAAPAAGMAQAMQWWGALTQQFQHIAQQAMQDPAQQQAMRKATQMGSEFAQTAVKTASDMVRQAVANVPSTTQPAASARKPATQSSAKAPVKAVNKAAPKPAAQRKTAAKKAVLADKKPTSAAAKNKAVAAKKSNVSKPRSR